MVKTNGGHSKSETLSRFEFFELFLGHIRKCKWFLGAHQFKIRLLILCSGSPPPNIMQSNHQIKVGPEIGFRGREKSYHTLYDPHLPAILNLPNIQVGQGSEVLTKHLRLFQPSKNIMSCDSEFESCDVTYPRCGISVTKPSDLFVNVRLKNDIFLTLVVCDPSRYCPVP